MLRCRAHKAGTRGAPCSDLPGWPHSPSASFPTSQGSRLDALEVVVELCVQNAPLDAVAQHVEPVPA